MNLVVGLSDTLSKLHEELYPQQAETEEGEIATSLSSTPIPSLLLHIHKAKLWDSGKERIQSLINACTDLVSEVAEPQINEPSMQIDSKIVSMGNEAKVHMIDRSAGTDFVESKDASTTTQSINTIEKLDSESNGPRQHKADVNPLAPGSEDATKRAEQAASLLNKLSTALDSKYLCFSTAGLKGFGSEPAAPRPFTTNGASTASAHPSLSPHGPQALQSRNPLRSSTCIPAISSRPYPAPVDPRLARTSDHHTSSTSSRRPTISTVGIDMYTTPDGLSASPVPAPASAPPSMAISARPSVFDIVPDYLKTRKRPASSLTNATRNKTLINPANSESLSPFTISEKRTAGTVQAAGLHLTDPADLGQQDEIQKDVQEPARKRPKHTDTPDSGESPMDLSMDGPDLGESTVKPSEAHSLAPSLFEPDPTEPKIPNSSDLEHLFDESIPAPAYGVATLPSRPSTTTPLLQKATASMPWRGGPTSSTSASASAIKSMFPVKKNTLLPPRPVPSLLENKILSSKGPVAIHARLPQSIDKARAAAANAHAKASAEAAAQPIPALRAPASSISTSANGSAKPGENSIKVVSPAVKSWPPDEPTKTSLPSAPLPSFRKTGRSEVPNTLSLPNESAPAVLDAVTINSAEKQGELREAELRNKLKRHRGAGYSPTERTNKHVSPLLTVDSEVLQADENEHTAIPATASPVRRESGRDKTGTITHKPSKHSGPDIPTPASRVPQSRRLVPVVEVFNRKPSTPKADSFAFVSTTTTFHSGNSSGDSNSLTVKAKSSANLSRLPSASEKTSGALSPPSHVNANTKSGRFPSAGKAGVIGITKASPSPDASFRSASAASASMSGNGQASAVIYISDDSSSDDDGYEENVTHVKTGRSKDKLAKSDPPKSPNVMDRAIKPGGAAVPALTPEGQAFREVYLAQKATEHAPSTRSEPERGNGHFDVSASSTQSEISAENAKEDSPIPPGNFNDNIKVLRKLAANGKPYITILKSDLAELESKGVKVIASYIEGHLGRQKPFEVTHSFFASR